jgi:hypothetical protein
MGLAVPEAIGLRVGATAHDAGDKRVAARLVRCVLCGKISLELPFHDGSLTRLQYVQIQVKDDTGLNRDMRGITARAMIIARSHPL